MRHAISILVPSDLAGRVFVLVSAWSIAGLLASGVMALGCNKAEPVALPNAPAPVTLPAPHLLSVSALPVMIDGKPCGVADEIDGRFVWAPCDAVRKAVSR